MTLETKLGARPNGWAPLRSALSAVVAAAFAVTMTAPSQFAFAGVGGAGVLDHASTADKLLIQVGQGGGKGKGKGGGQARGQGGGGGNNKMVVRGPHGGKAVVSKGQKNTVVRRNTYVNKTYVNKRVVVVRPVRGWYRKPYYGNFVAGVALGTIIGVAAVGVAKMIEPGSLIVTERLDHEFICFPVSDVVSVPGRHQRIDIFGELPAICPDFPQCACPGKELQKPSGPLNEFHGLGLIVKPWNTRRIAITHQ